MNTQEKGILLLVKSALNGKKYNLPDGFDFSEAYQTAKKSSNTAAHLLRSNELQIEFQC